MIPFSYLSGMFYPTTGLPALARNLITANPLYYVIDGIRYGMTGVTETAVWPGLLLILVLDRSARGPGLSPFPARLAGEGVRAARRRV